MDKGAITAAVAAVDHHHALADPRLAASVALGVQCDDAGRPDDDVVDVAAVLAHLDGVQHAPVSTEPVTGRR